MNNAPLTARIPLVGRIGTFIQMSVGAAGFRALVISVGIATVTLALRMVLGLERGAVGE